jgi:hypothetical protein
LARARSIALSSSSELHGLLRYSSANPPAVRASGEVGVTGKAVVAGGVLHQQRLARELGVAEGGQRQQTQPTGLVHGHRCVTLTSPRREEPDLRVVVPEHDPYPGRAGHRTEDFDDPGAQLPEIRLSAQRLEARRTASRSIASDDTASVRWAEPACRGLPTACKKG